MRNPYYRISMLVLTIMMVCSCAGFAAAEQTESTPGEAMLAYQAVLLSGQRYIQCNTFDGETVEAVMTTDITDWYGYIFDTPLRFLGFAVTDLDQNDVPELLLQLSGDFGYELLRYENGQVFGYPFVFRAMAAVTADGEIHGSSGANNFGWYRVRFVDEELHTAVICWKYDEEAPVYRYMIGDTQGTEEDFAAMNEALWQKPVLTFTDYSEEAVRAAAADASPAP